MNSLVLWCGLLGIIFSVIGVVVMFLTRKNIIDIIDKDIILFERNFEIKKNAITNCFDLLDEIASKGKQVALDAQYSQKAKKCYNELLCVVNNEKIAEEFYKIAIDFSFAVSLQRINEFKIKCRKDIGLKTRKSENSDSIEMIKPLVQQPEELKQSQQPTAPTKQVEQIDEDQQIKPASQSAVRPSTQRPQARPMAQQQARPTTQSPQSSVTRKMVRPKED